MKKYLFFTLIFCLIFFTACASKQTYEDENDVAYYAEGEEGAEDLSEIFVSPEITDDSLGNFNPIKIDSKVALVKSMDKLTPKQLDNNYLNPRNNTIELTFRYGVNITTIILDKKERTKIKEAAELFLSQYEAKELKRQKPKKNNAYFNSKCPFYWGVLSDSNTAPANDYFANYEIINKRAYFLLHFVPSRTKKADVFTPKTVLYFSPSQLKDFLDLVDQDYLNAQVQNLRDKAYTY